MSVRVRELLETAGPILRLRVVSGARGLDRPIAQPRLQQPGLALAGYLPQLHPDRVQVLGNSEISYLGTLEATRARDAVAAVAAAGVAYRARVNNSASMIELGTAAVDALRRGGWQLTPPIEQRPRHDPTPYDREASSAPPRRALGDIPDDWAG